MARHPVMVRQVCRLHPFESESQPSLRMVAEVLWLETGLLELTFNLQAKSESDALKDLKVTTAESLNNEANSERQDNLWIHTCFEAFFAKPDSEQYWELNVAPSGHWNLYQFDAYRSGGREEPGAVTPTTTWKQDDRECCCSITLNLAPWWTEPQLPELAITAVLENKTGEISYWALQHPGDRPDFHDRRGFLKW